MNFATYLTPGTSAWVAQSLAHILWQGTLVAGLAAVAALTLRNRSAQLRYLIYCGAMLLTAACLPLNLWFLSPLAQSDGVNPTRVASTGSSNQMPTNVDVGEAPDADVQPLIPSEANTFNGGVAEEVAEPLANAFDSTLAWEWAPRWIVAAYFIGIAIMAVRLLLGLYGSQRLRTTAKPVDEASLRQVVGRLGEQLRLRFIPVVAYSTRVTTPLVVGVVKPAILLPAAILNDLTTEQVESLLLHELAHIRRYDHWVNLLQRIIEAVLFFHPAVWWLSHKISFEREHCCDDLAIRWGSEPCDYAESLVRMSEIRYRTAGLSGSSAATLAATGNRPSQLRGRVLRVLGMPLPGPSVGLTRVGVGALLAASLATAAVIAALPAKSTTEADSGLPSVSVEDSSESTEQVESESQGTAKISGKIIVAGDGINQDPAGWFYSGSRSGNSSSFSTEGRFENSFECEVPAGVINLRFFPDSGYAPAVAGPFELKAGDTLSDVRVELSPGHAQTISVVTDGYQPIEGATVLAHPLLNGSTNGPNLPLTTNAKGQVVLEHVAANTRYAFRIDAPGFQQLRTKPRRLPHGGEGPLSLWMVRARPATGIVRFPDGSPAPGTKLKRLTEVFPAGGADNAVDPELIATTDGEGRFGLDSLNDGSAYVLVVEALDFNRVVTTDITAGTQDAQVVLPERRDLVVRVKGDLEEVPKRKGKPYVKIYQRFNVAWGDRSVGTLFTNYATLEPTGGGGQAIHRGLAIDLRPDAGPQQVEVMLGQDESTKQVVEIKRDSNKATFVEFDLRPAGQREKKEGVRPEGDERSFLSASQQASATEAKGAPIAKTVARPDVADLDYSRRKPKTVRVLTPDGKPAIGANFRVIWWRDDQGDYDFGTSEPKQVTNQRGEVVLSVPSGAERARLRVEGNGFAAVSDEFSLSGEPVVRLQSGRTVRVLAIGPEGSPLADAVPLLENCRKYPKEFEPIPGKPGHYESPVVALERRWMRVVAAGAEGQLLFSDLIDLNDATIVNGEGAIETQLRPGVRLVGKLDESVPRPVKIGCVELYIQQGEGMRIVDRDGWTYRDATPIREDGTFEFPSVPPGGHVQLFALADGYHSQRPTAEELRKYLSDEDAGDASLIVPALSRDYIPHLFPLPEEESAETDIVLPCTPTAAANVRVVDPLGRPLEGATVSFSPNCFFLGPEGELPAYGQFFDSTRAKPTPLNGGPLQPIREWALASFYRAQTDTDGVARVRNLPADRRQTCRVKAEGFVMPSEPGSSRDFDARYALIESKGGETIRRTITMERLIARSTRDLAVVDRSGKPIAGITVTASEIAFEDAKEDWQFWAVQRFGEVPTGKTDGGGQLRLDIPREIGGKAVAAIRVIVQGRVGQNAYVQRQRAVLPPEDDGGVLVLTESKEEPLRSDSLREVTVAYRSLDDLAEASHLSLLQELEREPSITVLKRLLAASGFDEASPLSFRTERNSLTTFSANPSPISRIRCADGERVVAMCRVRPSGASWDTKPQGRFAPEAALVFDATNGKLIRMIGGWASSRGSYCNATLTDLGTPGDYFVATSAFEDNGSFEYVKRWTRLGHEKEPALTVYGYANAMSWSGSTGNLPAGEFGHTGYDFNSQDTEDRIPGLQPSGAPAPRKIYWDGRLDKFLGPAEQSLEGKPLYRVDLDKSNAFEEVSIEDGELMVAGGRRSYRNWHLWDVLVPGDRSATFTLVLERQTDSEDIREISEKWAIPAGMHKLQLYVDPDAKAGEPNVEVRVDKKKYEESFKTPSIDFARQASARGKPVVRQGERSVLLLSYPTTEEGVRLVGTLTMD